MKRIEMSKFGGEAVAKRAFWLAWQACWRPEVMGLLRDKPTATEALIWANVRSAGDYNMNLTSSPGEVYGDYVFGRMMKLWIGYDNESVSVPLLEVNSSYQGWASKYSTYEKLIERAVGSLAVDEHIDSSRIGREDRV